MLRVHHQLSVLIIVCLFALTVRAYPNGAPCEAVDELQPGEPHGPPQTILPPYGIRVLSGNDRVRNGAIKAHILYTVEIYGWCGEWAPVKGYLIKATNASTGSVIGRFSKDDQAYWQGAQYACRDTNLGAVTHFVAYDKTRVISFKWLLDEGPRNVEYKDVKFEATVMQNLKTYWKGIAWPESVESECRCPDQEQYKTACAGYHQAGYCDQATVRDTFCPYTCNNCSTGGAVQSTAVKSTISVSPVSSPILNAASGSFISPVNSSVNSSGATPLPSPIEPSQPTTMAPIQTSSTSGTSSASPTSPSIPPESVTANSTTALRNPNFFSFLIKLLNASSLHLWN